MFDMIKSGSLPTSQALHIMLNNLEQESAVEILEDCLCRIIPCILTKYNHESMTTSGGSFLDNVFERSSGEIFNMTRRIMASGRFNKLPSVMEMLLLSAVGFANSTYTVSDITYW